MMARNPHGQKLPAALHGRVRISRAAVVELLDRTARGRCGEAAQPPPQLRTPGSSMAFQHRQENQPGSPGRVSPSFSKCASVPGQQIHPRLAAGREKFSGVGGSCLPWMASVPHPTAPAAGLHLSVRRERGAKGILPRTFSWRFFLSLNVEKLNARFESLIRLSSFCHLFCFVMHYIQLHVSNPQILPRRWNTCQAFPFLSAAAALKALGDELTSRNALASPTAAILWTWKPPSPMTGAQNAPYPCPAQREGLQPWHCSQEPSPGLNPREGAPSIPAKGARLSISEREITFCKSPTVNQLPSQI